MTCGSSSPTLSSRTYSPVSPSATDTPVLRVLEQVCWRWNDTFYSQRVWHKFRLGDRTLTRRRFNYYTGYQHTLDHYRTQMCLLKMGHHFRHLVLGPMTNLFNLYEFMTLMSFFAERPEGNFFAKIRVLEFTFSCTETPSDAVFGTGGKLLEGVRRLMRNLPGLRELSLRDLLLEDRGEAGGLLDDVASQCCETLRRLELVNITRESQALLHCGVFLRLSHLIVTPHQLDEEVVELLGWCPHLTNLTILHTKLTPPSKPVPPRAWKQCRKQAPHLRVHLVVEGRINMEVLHVVHAMIIMVGRSRRLLLLIDRQANQPGLWQVVWQEGAPVYSVIYDSPYVPVSPLSTLTPSTLFPADLRQYGHLGLPRFYVPRLFEDRADSPLVCSFFFLFHTGFNIRVQVLLCRSCPNLHTLAVRERVSTATVLLLAHAGTRPGHCLRRLAVRRNAVVLRCEWPRHPDWPYGFHAWLRKASRSYERVEAEVSVLFGKPWRFLSDFEYRHFTF
ncbi:hypothetical protein LAZ67_5000703 [Cordylochernes scorpioides]|uniref:Uncharacterized protein n=1 Tax=Cordylochernes scorpioides TaxID=51811 RepID=A0ABY6KF51_9ARAC|nr:hypothetical protein LAZ67_5000703 [Cordylochernes scorpioides]